MAVHHLILSVGCGGNLRYRAKTLRDVNVDLFLPEDKVDNFVQADALSLPFREGIFDCVYSRSLIEHLDDPSKFIRECRRVGRQVEILLPHYMSTCAYLDPDHKWVYFRGRFRRISPVLHHFFRPFFSVDWGRYGVCDTKRYPLQESRIFLGGDTFSKR